MISRKALDDTIAEYQTALAKIDDAARTLENASVMAGAVSWDFTRISKQLIDDTNSAYHRINMAIGMLERAHPDDA